MAQTTYITPAELIESFDSRIVLQLSSYTGTPAVVGDIATNAIILNAIEKASGEVESYSLRGGIYTVTILTALQADDDWFLKQLVSTLTMKWLYLGKTGNIPGDMQTMIGDARQSLEDLREGKRVFNQDSVKSAGRASIHITSASVRARTNMPSDSKFFPPKITRVY